MYVAEEHDALTPAEFIRFVTNKPPVGAAIILQLPNGFALVAVGREGSYDERFVNLEGVPLFVVTNDLSAEQWAQVVEDGYHHFSKHGPVNVLKMVVELRNWLAPQPTA